MEEYNDDEYCYGDRNSSCRKTSISTSISITLYIFFSLISVVTVFLNLLVIISISHFKQLHTPSNLLVLSLAVSDLLVGLIVIPANTVALLESCWAPGKYFCVLLYYNTYSCTSSSVGNLVLISIDRYVAICDPLKYHLKITIRRTMCCIFISWFCCFIYDAIYVKVHINVQVPSRCFDECFFFVEGDFWFSTIDYVLTVASPCFIIIILYLKIFIVANSQAKKVFSKNVANTFGVCQVKANKSERKAAKTLGIVVFNYLLFWNPLIWVLYYTSTNKLAALFLSFIPLVNSFINPIIYAFFYPWFKVTSKRILTLDLRQS